MPETIRYRRELMPGVEIVWVDEVSSVHRGPQGVQERAGEPAELGIEQQEPEPVASRHADQQVNERVHARE